MKVCFEVRRSVGENDGEVREFRQEHEVGWGLDGHGYMEMFAAFLFALGFHPKTITDVALEYAEMNTDEEPDDPTENWAKDAEGEKNGD